jgi:hypothetical protein
MVKRDEWRNGKLPQRYDYEKLIGRAKKKPNQWVPVLRGQYPEANYPIKEFQKKGCLTARRTKDGAVTIWICWPDKGDTHEGT